MADTAGLIKVGSLGGVTLLSLAPTATALAAPLAGYGNAGNDSGALMIEGSGFPRWSFQLTGPGCQSAGYTVTLYGTISPALKLYEKTTGIPINTLTLVQLATVIPATDWVLLPGPSESAGTGTIANPMVSGTSNLFSLGTTPLTAVRAVLTTLGTPTLGVKVLGFATA